MSEEGKSKCAKLGIANTGFTNPKKREGKILNSFPHSQIPIFVNSDVISLQKEALMIKDTSLLLNALDSMLKKIDYYYLG